MICPICTTPPASALTIRCLECGRDVCCDCFDEWNGLCVVCAVVEPTDTERQGQEKEEG